MARLDEQLDQYQTHCKTLEGAAEEHHLDFHDAYFKDAEANMAESYYIPEDPTLQDESERLRKMLDAKYEAADPADIVTESEKSQLKDLLTKHQALFDI